MPPTRPRPVSLAIIPSWRAPRPPTPRRAIYPLPITTSIRLSNSIHVAPPIPPLSYWIPDTPSPFTTSSPASPLSPINPFLVPPKVSSSLSTALLPTAAPLLPASPLSIFDRAISPTSPTIAMSKAILQAMTPSFLLSQAPSSVKRTILAPRTPLTPRFLFPRTPPVAPTCSLVREVAQLQRNSSVVNAGTTEQQQLEMKINMYRLVALKNWKEMERFDQKGKTKSMLKEGWKTLLGRRRGMKAKGRCDEIIRCLE